MHITKTPRWTNKVVDLFLLQPNDVTATYVGWLNDPIVNRYLESRFMKHTLNSTRQFVQRCLDDESTLLLGIRATECRGEHVGNIKLGPVDMRHQRGEVGVLIGNRKAWGKGVASSAITMLSEIASDELALRKLSAGCYASNIGSQRAFLKAGFELEGERKAHFLLDGKPEGLVLMGRLLQ